MELPVTYFIVFLAFVLTVPSYADMYRQQQMSRPAKVIHVHHYDAGSSGSMMSSNYKKMDSGSSGGMGSSLIELLILSSLLSGTSNTATGQTALINGQLVPIQNG